MWDTSSIVISAQLGWAILVSLICVSVACGIWMHKRAKQDRLESEVVFKQCASGIMDASPPEKEIKEYELKREKFFVESTEAGLCSNEESDVTDFGLAGEAWQRKIDVEKRKQLKVLLLKRAFANVPRWIHLSGEMNSKHRLYTRGLLEPKAWAYFQAAQQDLQEELEYIRLEAECLENEWGEKILKDSMILYRLQEAQKQRMKQQEEEKRNKEKEELRLKEQEKSNQKEAELRAERNAEKLIREEENSSVKKVKNPKPA